MERTCPYCQGAIVGYVDVSGNTVILCSQCKQPPPDDVGLREQLDEGPATDGAPRSSARARAPKDGGV